MVKYVVCVVVCLFFNFFILILFFFLILKHFWVFCFVITNVESVQLKLMEWLIADILSIGQNLKLSLCFRCHCLLGSIFFFLDWAQKCRLNAKLNLGFFYLLGHELGPIPKRGPAGAGPGPGKKPGILNGPGLGYGSCPAGRVQIWKNPARTRPVAIPNFW